MKSIFRNLNCSHVKSHWNWQVFQSLINFISQCGNFRILREINIWDSRSAQFAILNRFRGSEFWFYEVLYFLKDWIRQMNKIQFYTLEILQNWFHVQSEWQKNPEIDTLWVDVTDFCSWVSTLLNTQSVKQYSSPKNLDARNVLWFHETFLCSGFGLLNGIIPSECTARLGFEHNYEDYSGQFLLFTCLYQKNTH